MEHNVTLDIHYSTLKEIWEKIGKIYASMPYEGGYENESKWIGEDIEI